MSFLAMSAAPIENENNNNGNYNTDTIINKKKYANTPHSKTQKQRLPLSDFDSQKVNSVLQSIHNTTSDDNELGNYKPNGNAETAKHSENFKPLNPYEFPAKPMSMGGERTKNSNVEGMTNKDDNLVPKPLEDDNLELQNLQSNFLNDAEVKNYFKRLVPNYNHKHASNQSNSERSATYPKSINNFENHDTNQVLLEKLNYMINLLEEQQDQKTGSVTEEVVLYSFLGVFIIFIVDSFARVGKYVR
jgi:hypothetical protein